MAKEVRFEVAGGVARVTIDRPERRNALAWSTVGELRRALARAGDDTGVRVVVLTGAGDRAFCAGADLAGTAAGDGDVAGAHRDRGEVAELFLDLWSLGKPTIARVKGAALAGGFGLAVACDLVVASDDAVFGLPEIDVGLWPFLAGVPLARALPPRKALELMMTGRRIDAREADAMGFLTRVVPADQLDAAVDELAATLAAKPAETLRLGRDAFYAVWGLGAREAFGQLHPLLTLASLTEAAREGAAAFAEKRPPRWS
ncbi:MAG: enoyl-CoA hydratase/isomerase family protein [Acidimicrobiales bacterium]